MDAAAGQRPVHVFQPGLDPRGGRDAAVPAGGQQAIREVPVFRSILIDGQAAPGTARVRIY